MPSLVLFPRPGVRTQLLNLYKRITTIGTADDNDIVLSDPELEDHHCQIFFDGKKYHVSTLSSGAEVHVNGKKTRKSQVNDQDVLRLGRFTLQFSLYDIPAEEFSASDVVTKDSLRKLLEFTMALMEHSDLQSLVDLLLDKLIELSGADKGFLFLMDSDRPTLHAARNIEKEYLTRSSGGFSDSIVNRVVQTRQAVLVSDAMSDAQFSAARSVVDLRLCSVMCSPLLCRGELLGLIYLGNDNVVNLFGQESLEMLQIFSSQAGLLVRNAILINELTVKSDRLEQQLEEIKFGEIIGASQGMRDVFRKIEKVATTDIGVLIRGETGSGKELIARECHKRSNRAEGPFVAINAGAIPESLLESELFGHEKGAFTGAHAATAGKFQAAHKGTLFLDEIGDLPYSLQSKLLRAIEQKQVTRVGSTRPESVDIRIVAATNKNLEEAVANGGFRQDLYYRLNVVTIRVPPLREREGDVELLARYFIQKFIRQYKSRVRGFAEDALGAMRIFDWPGNVRELENRIRKAIVLADGELLAAEDLELSRDVGAVPLAQAKEDFQRRYVLSVLRKNSGNKTQTARELGVDPRTIFRYLEKERDDEGDSE